VTNVTRSIRIPVWVGGRPIALRDVLAGVPDNDWDWRLWDLHAIGRAPHGPSLPEFERAVRAAPRGYRLSWAELSDFAAAAEDIHDCLLTVATPGHEPTAEEVMAEDYRRLLVVISLEDSTFWDLFSRLGGEIGESLYGTWRSLAEERGSTAAC
jgi:hypothetical protein